MRGERYQMSIQTYKKKRTKTPWLRKKEISKQRIVYKHEQKTQD